MEIRQVLQFFFGKKAEKFSAKPLTNGHINHTYTICDEETGRKYILQKVNTNIFTRPEILANNHLETNKILKKNGYGKQILTPVLTLQGNYFDEAEHAWRMTDFIENSTTYLKVPNPETAFAAATAFSEFYEKLNLPGTDAKIEQPLPGFLDFDKRMKDYISAKEIAPKNLLESAQEEISFLEGHRDLLHLWENIVKISEPRIIHGDPKISNILYDDSGAPLTIIDPDTIMRGPLLYDFGDMVRSYTNKTDENNADFTDNFDEKIFTTIKRGFFSRLQNLLSAEEISFADEAAVCVIYIQALRFLTDYLAGNTYYAVAHETENLSRAKNQISLLSGLLVFLGKN